MVQHQLETHRLIGDYFENFYQIGLKDADSFHQVNGHILSIIGLNHGAFRYLVKPYLAAQLQHILKNNKLFVKEMEAYSEGLKAHFNDVTLAMLIPEIISSLHSFIPHLPTTLFGCSSLFFIDELTKEPTHLRILDFPLTSTFESNERALEFQLKDHPQIYSLGTKGFPYPSLTAMSSSGLTIALHQKFTENFNLSGTPIFSLINQLLLECSSIKEIIAFLKKSKSITTWGINIMSTKGEVLLGDITPEKFFFKTDQLEPKKIIYTNNLRCDGKKSKNPHSIDYYCHSRLKNAQHLIQNEKKFTRESISSSLFHHKPKSEFEVPLRTYSTVQLSMLTPGVNEIIFFQGNSPKSNVNHPVLKISNIFSKQKFSEVKYKFKGEPAFEQGLSHVALAQKEIDLGSDTLSYHHLQIALLYLKKSPHYPIIKFYFLILRFLRESDLDTHLLIYQELQKLTLPSYLNEHAKLFIALIELLADLPPTISENDFKEMSIRNVYRLNNKIFRKILYQTVSKLTFIRMDILDIVYGYEIELGKTSDKI